MPRADTKHPPGLYSGVMSEEQPGFLRRTLKGLVSSESELEAEDLQEVSGKLGGCPVKELPERRSAVVCGTLRTVTLRPAGQRARPGRRAVRRQRHPDRRLAGPAPDPRHRAWPPARGSPAGSPGATAGQSSSTRRTSCCLLQPVTEAGLLGESPSHGRGAGPQPALPADRRPAGVAGSRAADDRLRDPVVGAPGLRARGLGHGRGRRRPAGGPADPAPNAALRPEQPARASRSRRTSSIAAAGRRTPSCPASSTASRSAR